MLRDRSEEQIPRNICMKILESVHSHDHCPDAPSKNSNRFPEGLLFHNSRHKNKIIQRVFPSATRYMQN